MVSLGATFFIIIAILFYQLMKKAEPRSLFVLSTIFDFLSGVFGLILAKQWNKKAGIPDSVMYWSANLALSTCTFVFSVLPA
jgi:hypothetical protein